MSVIRDEARYIVPTYKRTDVVFERGAGVYLFDRDGRRYLDFAAGIAVNALGHADPEWVAAVSTQAATLAHVSNIFHSEPQVRLAKALVSSCFADRVFFCNSGTEANEAAIKFARKVAFASGATGKHALVAFENGFHGRTMGALSVTHNPGYRDPFAPLIPGVRFASFNDIDAATRAIDDDTCAVIVEPVQGEGGVHPADKNFVQALRQRCDEKSALLIFDEVQCGLGRTGTLWAHEAFGVQPDMMTVAKPLAGGLPIGATLVTERVSSSIVRRDHGSTFAGGPLVCHAAEIVFSRVSDLAFLTHVQSVSEHLFERLGRLTRHVTCVRGKGLLVGIELDTLAAPIVEQARDAGLIIITAGENVLRLAPPLIIEASHVDICVDTLERILAHV